VNVCDIVRKALRKNT